jgi:hypothetical protein
LSPTPLCATPGGRYLDLNNIVLNVSGYPTAGSYQDLAYSWLLNNDTQTTACAGNKIPIQRYVLATVFYSTGGDKWLRQNGWLNQTTNQCSWYGVTCNSAKNIIDLNLGKAHHDLFKESFFSY